MLAIYYSLVINFTFAHLTVTMIKHGLLRWIALMSLLILQKMAKKVPAPAKRAVSGIAKTADVTSHPPTISQKVDSAPVIQCHSSYFFMDN
jgi:hypothetical protein